MVQEKPENQCIDAKNIFFLFFNSHIIPPPCICPKSSPSSCPTQSEAAHAFAQQCQHALDEKDAELRMASVARAELETQARARVSDAKSIIIAMTSENIPILT